MTRDYVLELDANPDAAPLLDIYGGKITTYRRLAEHALEKLAPFLRGAQGPWTAGAILPGGDLPNRDPAAFAHGLTRDYPFLGTDAALRLARSYGIDARRILGSASRAEDLGRMFGYGFSERELDWLVKEDGPLLERMCCGDARNSACIWTATQREQSWHCSTATALGDEPLLHGAEISAADVPQACRSRTRCEDQRLI